MGELTDQNKVAVMLDSLTGRVFTWALSIWEKRGELISSFNWFNSTFCRVFNHAPEGREVGDRLRSISQGRQRVVQFALKFPYNQPPPRPTRYVLCTSCLHTVCRRADAIRQHSYLPLSEHDSVRRYYVSTAGAQIIVSYNTPSVLYPQGFPPTPQIWK